MTKKQNEVMQFMLNFKTATEEQIIKLTKCNVQDISYLLSNQLIIKDKETGLIYHKIRGIDVKFMIALDVICMYKEELQSYNKSKFPVIISFVAYDVSYDIIVSKEIEQKRICELLDEISFSDRIILIIENKETLDVSYINTNREILICTYPLEIIKKVN